MMPATANRTMRAALTAYTAGDRATAVQILGALDETETSAVLAELVVFTAVLVQEAPELLRAYALVVEAHD